MLRLLDRLLNKIGYYKLVSNDYYVTIQDSQLKIAEQSKAHKEFDEQKVKLATELLLDGLGEDINRPGLIETPRRVAGYWKELTEGTHLTNKQIAERYNKSFDVSYSNLVVKEVENVFSHCEHHLALMYNGTVYVAYIPMKNSDNTYKVLGLSKIDRIVHLCSKRLQLQEKLAADIAECIQYATGSDMVYVQIVMNHGCVSARGPKSSGLTDVTFISEELKDNIELRREIETKIANLRK